MQSVTNDNFGPLIAYLVPGATVLLGLSQFSPTLQSWFAATSTDGPTIGGFLYLTVSSLAVGMVVSTVRWVIIDTIHGWTGLPPPAWDSSRLEEKVAAYNVLTDIHYKFYQFHGNLLVAVLFVYFARRAHLGFLIAPLGWLDVGFLVLSLILFVGSRDTLRKYHARLTLLLGTTRRSSQKRRRAS